MALIHSVFLKQCLFYASYLVFPFILWQSWRVYRRRGQRRFLSITLLVMCGMFVWMRFVEPQMIRVRETTINHPTINARIALISDIHMGLYKGPYFLERVVARINQMDVDMVLIAGDLSYYPSEPLVDVFSSLKRLNVPTYAVLGNHDQERPGPNIDAALRAALAELNVTVIEHQVVDTGDFLIAGLGDRWARKDDTTHINQGIFTKPLLALMHNPDSAIDLDARRVAFAFAGHTHCGQIRIPMLSNYFTPGEHGLYCGMMLAETAHGKLPMFISAGVGEVGIPLRLFNPPTIEYLHFVTQYAR